MKPEQFKEVVSEMHTQCCDLLRVKEMDYSDGKDRLTQFKRGAALDGVTPLEDLKGMMKKHTTKLYYMIEETRNGKMFDQKQWEEVINDHTNYLYLLKALLIDEGAI